MPIDERQALQDVMLNYAAAVDDRDEAGYRACFTDDVEAIGFGDRSYHGVDDWVGYVFSALENFSSSQHLLAPQLAIIDGDGARTRNDVQAIHVLDDGGLFTLWGTYLTNMLRTEAGWKIARHELVVRATRTA